MAEWVSDDATARSRMRDFYQEHAVLSSHYDGQKPRQKRLGFVITLHGLSPYIGFLRIDCWLSDVAKPKGLTYAGQGGRRGSHWSPQSQFVTGQGPVAQQVGMACEDGFKRLMGPSMETDFRLQSRKQPMSRPVRVFADNIRELLMAAPLGQKPVLALDPGFCGLQTRHPGCSRCTCCSLTV